MSRLLNVITKARKALTVNQDVSISVDCLYDDIANYDKPIIVSVLDDDTVPLKEAKTLKDFILVIGNESHGVSEEIIAKASQKVKIEMSDKIDSLNAAIAAGILMNHYK